MLITCPNCAAGYNVPDHLLAGAGRRLRCARCAHDWLAQLPPPPPPAPLFPPEAYPSAIPDRGEISLSTQDPPRPPRAPLPLAPALAAWVLSLCVIGSLGWGAVHWRSKVMDVWPPSARAYQAVGLD